MKLKILCAAVVAALCAFAGSAGERWSVEKANAWYDQLPWMAGSDYIPATAINQIEMWSADTYDRATIDKELAWAQDLGFTTLRVYLSSVVWKNDPVGMKERMDDFLGRCKDHNLRPVLVFFDDCWNPESAIGPQPEPKPGIHNSGWVRDPSESLRKDTVALYPVLERYVKDILTTFKDDDRVLWWDLYNEPGNSGHGTESFPLLKNVYRWAREVGPSQPVSSGVWCYSDYDMNAFQLENSDIISYHSYSNPDHDSAIVDLFLSLDRPVYCTEYMARMFDSIFQNTLPLLREKNISAINWGFVSGKTNTIFAWSDPRPDGKEPELWFHDIYRQDKTPFDQAEIDAIKEVNSKR